jgi:hypothetical protein
LGVVALIVLAAIWAAFLLPPIFRARAESRPSGSISDFRRQLRVLSRVSPTSAPLPSPLPMASRTRPNPFATVHAAPRPRQLAHSKRSVKRRRDIFVGLLVAMAGSLVLGFLPPLRALWALHVVIDVLFVAYVGLLVYLRNLAAEREMKVRFLPTPRGAAVGAPEPALLYRRSAN